ncbi:PhnB protein [Pseudomonas sp. 8AS]|uniref:VOC family protein n=1 Tax=Pseudomonas sp. 8AS TaxID=2653163 RepID=UPI0012EFE038|nr:VOC family protein [Pseudomonas sp. 8AS]VXB82030.1 PhnB protein [Pseudomonas sp. 8AS]
MKIHAYLFFAGQCAEAMGFYAQCLGGELNLMRFSDNPEGAEGVPAEYRERILHACLMVGEEVLMASDSLPEQGCGSASEATGVKGCAMSLQVDSIREAERLFAALSAGGQVRMPLQQTFWAARFGMLEDRFGVAWMINCEVDKAG